MPRRSVRVAACRPMTATASDVLAAPVRAIEAELELSAEFPPEVLAAAEDAAANPKLPELDRTDIPFITIDPPGSKDLDQALHIERHGEGFRVHYAIADVAAFVEPDGPIDVEAHRRGQTMYAPEHRIPLHPPVLSEGAASLLPDQVRPALLWTIDLDERGEGIQIDVERALVRAASSSTTPARRRRSTTAPPTRSCVLLKEVGELRWERERERGGISLPLPEQEVVVDGRPLVADLPRRCCPSRSGTRRSRCSPGWARPRSCCTARRASSGRCRPAPDWALAKLRRTAAALKIDWHPDIDYPDFVRSLDPNTPTGAAMLNACTGLLRGAGLRRLRRGSARAHRARRPRQRVRPRHRTAASAGRPVCRRGLRRDVRRHRHPDLGAGQAARTCPR